MEIHVPYVTSGKHRAVAKMFRHPGLATTMAASDGNQELKKKNYLLNFLLFTSTFLNFLRTKVSLLLFKVLILLPILSTLKFCCLLLRSKG